MSITIPDAPGIDVAGRVKTWFVPAIADSSAPTVAEITAGVEITCALYGLNETLDQPTTSRAKRCYRQPSQALGRAAYSLEPIEYDYDPQAPDSPDYAYGEMTPGLTGYIVDRLGLDKEDPLVTGQIVKLIRVELGGRSDAPIDATSTDPQKFRVTQVVAVQEIIRDVEIAA